MSSEHKTLQSYVHNEGGSLVGGVYDAAGQPAALAQQERRLGGHAARPGRHPRPHACYLGDSLSVLGGVESLYCSPGIVLIYYQPM